MTIDLAVALFALGLVAVGYLVYRYGRFSPWRSTPVGRSYMLMKTSLLSFFIYAVAAAIWPDWAGRDLMRLILIGYTDIALIVQVRQIIRYQGGWRRQNPIKDDVTELDYSPRD